MKHKLSTILVIALVTLLVGAGGAAAQTTGPEVPSALLGTAFTYQGRLSQDGSPADGVYDFCFILYDADVGGAQVGSTLSIDDRLSTRGISPYCLTSAPAPSPGKRSGWRSAVRPGSSSGGVHELMPRQALDRHAVRSLQPGRSLERAGWGAIWFCRWRGQRLVCSQPHG